MEFLQFAVENSGWFKVLAVVAVVAPLLMFRSLESCKPLPDSAVGDDGLSLAVAFKRQHGVLNFLAVYGGIALAVVLYFFPLVAEAIL